MGLRLPCPWRSTRRTGSRFLLGQTFLLWYNYEMAKMTIIAKILMRSWILDKAISKCWINIREDENADQTLIFIIPKRGHMKLQNSRRHFAQCFSFSITCFLHLLWYTWRTRSKLWFVQGCTLVIGCHFHCLTIVKISILHAGCWWKVIFIVVIGYVWVLPLTRVFVIFPLLKYKLQGGQQVKYGQGGTDKIFCPIGSLPQSWSLPNPLNEEEEEEACLFPLFWAKNSHCTAR